MATINPPIPPTTADAFVGPAESTASMDEPIKGLGKWRRPIGLTMLGVVVFLWTASNFLSSAVLADDTYSKPFFLTYFNTAFFIVPLIPVLSLRAYRRPEEFREWRHEIVALIRRPRRLLERSRPHPPDPGPPGRRTSLSESHPFLSSPKPQTSPLTLLQTTRLASEFSLLWFLANYFIGLSLEHTTVASSTILTSTSSIFTLALGVLARVEIFTCRKLLGVLASLAGIALISSVDLSGENTDDDHRGSFPSKSPADVAVGDLLALAAAGLYGVYAVLMKKRIEDESAVEMPLFFGLVGLLNVVVLWPGFFILHWTGAETFHGLPAGNTTMIVVLNALASGVADLAWGYAVLMTGPIVVTVGLSLTIPLSLLGEKVVNGQTAGGWYWVGAGMVVVSFLFVNHEEKKDEGRSPLEASGILSRDGSIESAVD